LLQRQKPVFSKKTGFFRRGVSVLDIIHERKQGIVLSVQVVPRAPRNEILGIHGDALRIRLKAPPVEGAANAALIAFLAETLGIRQQQVEILSGHTSRRKSVLVSGLGKEQVARMLGERLR
jgi:uncharacterized protein (TIGR00251 family)